MKKLILLLSFLLLSLCRCDNNNPVTPVTPITITMDNKVGLVLSLYQNGHLADVMPSSTKNIMCSAGSIEAIPNGQPSIFFTARNNSKYTYNSGKITEGK